MKLKCLAFLVLAAACSKAPEGLAPDYSPCGIVNGTVLNSNTSGTGVLYGNGGRCSASDCSAKRLPIRLLTLVSMSSVERSAIRWAGPGIVRRA